MLSSLVCLSGIQQQSEAIADPFPEIHSEIQNDSGSLENKKSRLKESDALMALFSGAPSSQVVNQYIEFFAQNSTDEQISLFLKKTEGKHFEISGTPSHPQIELRPGNPTMTYDMPTCWKDWSAAAAYFLASNMICAPFYLAGSVPGFICAGVFFAAGTLPDFNSWCK